MISFNETNGNANARSLHERLPDLQRGIVVVHGRIKRGIDLSLLFVPISNLEFHALASESSERKVEALLVINERELDALQVNFTPRLSRKWTLK